MTELTGRLRRRAAPEGFTMTSAAEDGRLLTALAAAKPGGAILELGTGTGLGTASLLAGMNEASSRTWTRRLPWSRSAAATWPTTCSAAELDTGPPGERR